MNKFPIRQYSLEELAVLLAVHPITLKKWLEPFNTEIGQPAEQTFDGLKYSTDQVKIIFDKIDSVQ